MPATSDDIRALLLRKLRSSITAKKLRPEDITDNFDLLTQGVIDSMGFIELIVFFEQQFNTEIDFDEMDAEELTLVGPLCRFIQSKVAVLEQENNGTVT